MADGGGDLLMFSDSLQMRSFYQRYTPNSECEYYSDFSVCIFQAFFAVKLCLCFLTEQTIICVSILLLLVDFVYVYFFGSVYKQNKEILYYKCRLCICTKKPSS